jgi:hypothetical protein
MEFVDGLKAVTLRDRQGSDDIRNLFEFNKMTDDIEECEEEWRNHIHWMPVYR